MHYINLSQTVVVVSVVAVLTLLYYNSEFVRGPRHNKGDQILSHERTCLTNFFSDVLLIIVYHYPSYSTDSFVVSHYKKAFPHILVCGPKDNSRSKILAADIGPRGYYSYECLSKAMRLHPRYNGYLFVNDDMIVNWWNFAALDKSKVWQGAPIDMEVAHEVGRRPVPNDWMWWTSVNGAVNCENAYKDIASLENEMSTNLNISKLMETNFHNGDKRKLCFRTWSDFVYIPGQYRQHFILLGRIFFDNKVFLEIAFPTIMSFLSEQSSWEKVYGVYLTEVYGFQDFSNIKYVWPKYSEEVPFLHPVKFYGEKGSRNRKLYETRVIRYGEIFTNC